MGPDFASRLSAGDTAHVAVIVDASDANKGSVIRNYAQAVLATFEADLAENQRATRIITDVRMRFNPPLESVNLFVPGLIALVLTLVSALMTAISLSREKERGTLEVLLVSPLRPWHIIVGKGLPYLGLAFANVLTALLAAWLVFQVPFRVSVPLLLGESVLYALASLALGVFVTALSSSQRGAMMGAILAAMPPRAMPAGMILPLA